MLLGAANRDDVNARRVSDMCRACKKYTNLNSKSFNNWVVKFSMTDETLVEIIWRIERLRKRFERDPYNLSYEEIKLLLEQESFFEKFIK